jgi:hypothetical protein
MSLTVTVYAKPEPRMPQNALLCRDVFTVSKLPSRPFCCLPVGFNDRYEGLNARHMQRGGLHKGLSGLSIISASLKMAP